MMYQLYIHQLTQEKERKETVSYTNTYSHIHTHIRSKTSKIKKIAILQKTLICSFLPDVKSQGWDVDI